MRGTGTTHRKNVKLQKKMLNRTVKADQKKKLADRLSYLEAISESIALPQEILSGAPILNIQGRNSLLLENYKKVLEYSETVIKVQTKLYYLSIYGNDLKIQYYNRDEMKISGVFQNIEFS